MSEQTEAERRSYKEKLKSLCVTPGTLRTKTKVTTDVHDKHKVDVIEHWHDRQDVVVKPETIKRALKITQE